MEISEFWQLIDQTRSASAGDVDKQAELLTKALAALPPEEIIEYQRIFDKLDILAMGYDLRKVADLIYGGMGDSSWQDFRAWLIGQGQTIYENAIADPETLADVVAVEDRYKIIAEAIMFAANMAWQAQTGSDDEYIHYDAIYREAFDDGKELWRGLSIEEHDQRLKEHFPKIWAKFNWENPDSHLFPPSLA